MSNATLFSSLLCVSFLVALASGDSEKGCCIPRKFTARASIATNTAFRSTYAIADVAFDFEAKKSLVFQSIYKRGKLHRNITVLEDYNTNKRYIITNEENCYTSVIHKEMKNECFLENATFQGESYFGANSEKLAFKKYMIQKTERSPIGIKIKLEGHITVTKGECVPMREVLITKLYFFRTTQHVSFFEVKTDVKSDVFDVPEICVEKEIPPPFIANFESSSLKSQDAYQSEILEAEIPKAIDIALNFASV